MADLSRTVSTPSEDVARHDGHQQGNLNFIAFRHGWTRTFTLPAEEVDKLDYETLEAVIELNTLKLSSTHLRIFVEHPPNSGIWCKVRFWRDDGSLQSVLVQAFFANRLREGTIIRIEVRDGHDREDAMSIKSHSGIGRSILPGSLARPGQTKEWLKHNSLTRNLSRRSRRTITDASEDGGEPIPGPAPASRLQAIKYILGLSSKAPPPPPKTEEELMQDQQNEEENLRKRGWLPPMLRRLSSRKGKIYGNPFFGGGGSSRSLARKSTRQDEGEEENDEGEEENQAEAEAEGEQAKPEKQNGKWFGFLGNKSPPAAVTENPFDDGKVVAPARKPGAKEGTKLPKAKGKGKGKFNQELGGAKVVKKPSDAFEGTQRAVETADE